MHSHALHRGSGISSQGQTQSTLSGSRSSRMWQKCLDASISSILFGYLELDTWIEHDWLNMISWQDCIICKSSASLLDLFISSMWACQICQIHHVPRLSARRRSGCRWRHRFQHKGVRPVGSRWALHGWTWARCKQWLTMAHSPISQNHPKSK